VSAASVGIGMASFFACHLQMVGRCLSLLLQYLEETATKYYSASILLFSRKLFLNRL